MRNYFIALFVVFASLMYGQESYYYSGWGKIRNSRNEVVSSGELKSTYVNEYEIVKNYQDARTQRTIGSVLIGGGLGFALGYTASAFFGDVYFQPAPVIAGVVLAGVGLTFRLTSKKKLEDTVDKMNDHQRKLKYQSSIDSSQIIVNSNGIGLSVSF